MYRRLPLLLGILLSVVFISTALNVSTVYAEDANAWTNNTVNLRSGAGSNFPKIGELPPSTAVVMEARSGDMGWSLIHVAGGGLRGWVSVTLLQRAETIKFSSLPVSTEEVAAGSTGGSGGGAPSNNPPANATPNLSEVPVYTIPAQPLPSDIPTGAINAPVVPVITNAIRANMRVVFRRGKLLGNNPRVFSKVGDCHTDHPFFLEIIGNGKYDLGQYATLQEVINYFGVPPREGAGNSFNTRSMAAHSAFTSGAVLDWQEALKVSDKCNVQESPLRCEFRMDKPAVAIIMFGVVDVITMTPQQFNLYFNLYMRMIVQDSIDHGVIPILSTSAENPSSPNSRTFNQIVVRIARERALPMMNLQAALAGLPNQGLDGDGIHLTRPGNLDDAAVFNDVNLQYGYVMRNLVVLQTLDRVWRQILN
jgi:hypothetical protein